MGLAPNCEKRGTYWISAIQYLSVSRPRFPVANNGPAFVGPFRAHQLGETSVSPSIKQERTGRLLTAITIKGKRDQKSFAARVIRRTPIASRRATHESNPGLKAEP
jgi:hypothetical protein